MEFKYFCVVLIFGLNVIQSCGITVKEFTTLNGKQKLALDELRLRVDSQLVKDYTKEDQWLLRWLRETDFNVDSAERMILANLKWRKENKMDTILDEDFSDLVTNYEIMLEGCDKEGAAIMILPFGEWDVRKAVIAGKSARLLRLFNYIVEFAIWNMGEINGSGGEMSHIDLILDFEGVNLPTHACPSCISTYIQILINFQTRYPGFLNKAIAVNSPDFFIPVWQAFKQVLTPKFRNIFYFYGRDKSEWKRKLGKFVDSSSISRRFGGERTRGILGSELLALKNRNEIVYTCKSLAEDLPNAGGDEDYNEHF